MGAIIELLENESFDFTSELEKHYEEIFYYVYHQVRNIEDAKDLTQEIFIKVYQKIKMFDQRKASFRTWLYTIAHNYIMDYFRSSYYKKILKEKPLILDVEGQIDLLEHVIQNEKIETILNIMNRVLNKKHQMIMNLYFFSELKAVEIASISKIPEKTTFNIINESIKKLKRELEGDVNE